MHQSYLTGLTVSDIKNIYDEPASQVITQHGYLTGLTVTQIINFYNMATSHFFPILIMVNILMKTNIKFLQRKHFWQPFKFMICLTNLHCDMSVFVDPSSKHITNSYYTQNLSG
jgi:hypothetical protein